MPGFRETILSLGQLDAQGYSTKIDKGKMHVFSPTGEFMFSAYLHAGRYFLDSEFYYGYSVRKLEQEHAMILADAVVQNSAELWHCRIGHVS